VGAPTGRPGCVDQSSPTLRAVTPPSLFLAGMAVRARRPDRRARLVEQQFAPARFVDHEISFPETECFSPERGVVHDCEERDQYATARAPALRSVERYTEGSSDLRIVIVTGSSLSPLVRNVDHWLCLRGSLADSGAPRNRTKVSK
jgi:hypothetical protein